jgi:ubiquinone/menaquinone biosynthesis C-methylase UbiE
MPQVQTSPTAFDGIAADYDAQFTYTCVGREQRGAVHHYLNAILKAKPIGNALELNGGTGEDALWLAKQGIAVTCTDVSPQMVAQMERKSHLSRQDDKVTALVAGFDEIHQLPAGPYDLVFSNFGGLNCVPPSDLRDVAQDISGLTQAGSRVVIVMISNNCLLESLYFVSKFKFREAFRRWKGKAVTWLDNEHSQMTWYPSRRRLIKAFGPQWKVRAVRPIGMWVPPSYLEPFVQRHPALFSRLCKWDQSARDIALAARFSDHFLIDFERIA